MIILIFIVVLFLILCIGLLVEKMLHSDFTLTQITFQLKKDIKSIVKALIGQEMVRHIFTPVLAEELRKVAKPYSNTAFEIDVVASANSGTHFVGLHFVPKQALTKDELVEVSNLLLLKFRRYLWINDLQWKTFVCFKSGNDFVNVYIYYSELDEDSDNFIYRYKMSIREEIEPDFGTLQDNELNKELENVN